MNAFGNMCRRDRHGEAYGQVSRFHHSHRTLRHASAVDLRRPDGARAVPKSSLASVSTPNVSSPPVAIDSARSTLPENEDAGGVMDRFCMSDNTAHIIHITIINAEVSSWLSSGPGGTLHDA